MSTVLFRRPPHRAGPELPQGEIPLQEPPALAEPQGGGLWAVLTFLPMAAGSGAMVLMFMQPGSGPMTYLAAGMMGLSGVGMMFSQLGRTAGERKKRLKGERRDYLRYLGQMRRQTRKIMTSQREAMSWSHPDPNALWNIAVSERLWERRVSSEMFGTARVGVGRQRLAVRLRPPQTKPIEDLEPLCASALRRFVHAYTTVAGLPTVVVPKVFARILLGGDEETARGMARAMIAQLITFHSPDDLRIALCVSPERRADWDWVKWLPHTQHPSEQDAAGPVRLVTDTYPELEKLLGEEFADRPRFEVGTVPNKEEPYVVIVLDGAQLPPGARLGDGGFRNATVLDVSGALRWKAEKTTLRLKVAADKIEMVGADRVGTDTFTTVGAPDTLSLVRCRALARLVSPYRMGITTESVDPLQTNLDVTDLLGLDDPRTFDPEKLWATRSPWDRLCVPIGLSEDGQPIELDIKESAQGGMGPHGMLIGATGSGKSELLRTLVLSLALTHSSEVLNFVLTDFKGGATFAGLEKLQHTSAVITNLADELPLVDRMQDALSGELVRRQELLRRAGYASLVDYEKARAQGAAIPPLPTLFVVVDEFSELLSTKREFMDLFVMIGRLGRSLGVHLLLASQRLDEGRVHQLESHLSYRIGLRTFSAQESRAVLGVPDAYTLPTAPGNGYLKTNTTTLVRFKAAYVSGPLRAGESRPAQSVVSEQVVPFRSTYLEPRALPVEPVADDEQDQTAGSRESLMDVVLERLRGQGPPAHRVWLPPLGAPPSIDQLLGTLAPHPDFGLCPPDRAGHGELRVPIGIVDKPYEGVREPLVADLASGAGHAAVVGAPHSGKSTVIRTLVTALALTQTPREVQFYILDFGGGSLATLAGLPHVGGLATRLDAERVSRTVAEIKAILARREERFTEQRIESMADYRRRRRAGEFADDPFGDVFLVVDGMFTLRQDFDSLEGTLLDLANRGLAYGIHLVIGATRWSEIRPQLRDLLQTRFELHLGDAMDSEINSRAAGTVPAIPGRGLSPDRHHFLTALPRIDSSSATDDIADAGRATVEHIAKAWPGAKAPAVRMLPALLPAEQLPPPEGNLRVALGLDDQQLAPVWHDFTQNPHLMIFGDQESGKTNLLRLIAQAIDRRYAPGDARLMLADYRRDLLTCVPQERQLGYAVTSQALGEIVAGFAEKFQERLPGADITPDRLARRDWWTGPEMFLFVDDYELFGEGAMGPMAPLLELLPQGAEIGMHLIVARSSSGAGRSMMDPVLRRLWELNTPGIMLSTSREEGAFLGDARPRQFQAGRAQLVTRRRGPVIVQTGFVEVKENAAV